jgi:mRNA-degrading endonuclease toxin of MazEF toxin-antitoxin module
MKTAHVRNAVIISPDELNHHLRTVIIAPLTSTVRNYPYRVTCSLPDKISEIALDQLRTIDKSHMRIISAEMFLFVNHIQAIAQFFQLTPYIL